MAGHNPPSRRSLLAGLSVTAPLLAAAAGADPQPRGSAASRFKQAELRPEDFGAVGDGIADDSAAIQRAFDTLAARRISGVVILQPVHAYRCNDTLTLDCSVVSLWGQGALDFSACTGPCIRVIASSSAPPHTAENNYGHRGMISGALRLNGGGTERTSVGILFDSATPGTAAQLLVENLSISDCGVGIVFGARAYNNVFVRCDVFRCATCVRWSPAADNGERNTFIGCTLFNSRTAVELNQPASAIHLVSCSIDYTDTVYSVNGGAIFASDCHHESNSWAGRPFRCSGDGATIQMRGGAMIGQSEKLPTDIMFEIGKGASIRLDAMFLHNIVLATVGRGVTTWATGAGDFHAAGCESYNMSRLPVRLHEARTMLADPNFEADAWQDVVWRLDDGGKALTSRYGDAGDGIVLQRVRTNGQSALSVVKRSGAGALARMVLMCVPVYPGEQVLAGFEVRRDPRYPVVGAVGGIAPNWARIDGHGPGNVPIITKTESTGAVELDLTLDRYAVVTVTGFRSNRVVPRWATHFIVLADLSRAGPTGLLFRGLWCDTM